MNFVIKVADFGLSETLDTSKDYFRQGQDANVKLPLKWMAPESINDKVFSEKSDAVSIMLMNREGTGGEGGGREGSREGGRE
jgi:hypothetical protein